jgi:hypothetical protein
VYVGSRANIQGRAREGIGSCSSNPQICEALKTYPAETWTFAILETLPRDTLLVARLVAEQNHIERLCSSDPRFGFNIDWNPPQRWLTCKVCSTVFYGNFSGRYCSDLCQWDMTERGSGVYCFRCPDGRVYVGSRVDIRVRKKMGIAWNPNRRVSEALKTYPAETWTFAILEMVPRDKDLLEAEQSHIERLRSWDERFGFNIFPASWTNPSDLSVIAARAYRKEEAARNVGTQTRRPPTAISPQSVSS